MNLNTMAAVMNFVTRIENDTATFYESLFDRFSGLANQFQTFAKENKRFEKQIKQTYFGVITDTLESNFCFEGLRDEDYLLDLTLSEEPDEKEARKKAVEIESTLKRFYEVAAGMSAGLMADVPRLFQRIAKNRQERLSAL